jgi:hypothetical protein
MTAPGIDPRCPPFDPRTQCWLCLGPLGNAPASGSRMGLECDDCRDATDTADDRLACIGGGFSVRDIV